MQQGRIKVRLSGGICPIEILFFKIFLFIIFLRKRKFESKKKALLLCIISLDSTHVRECLLSVILAHIEDESWLCY